MDAMGIKLNGHRFVDDSKFCFDTLSDAEKALKEYQKVLNKYSLNLNDDKTSIQVIPCLFDSAWKCLINALPLESFNANRQRTHIKNYFNQLIYEAKNNPKDSVIKYGIKRLLKLKIHPANIDIFEPLLFNIVLSEPVVLPDLAYLLNKYTGKFSKIGIQDFLNSMLHRSVQNGHHFEVSWSLWIAKCCEIEISDNIAQTIIDSRDVVSIIILLDMITLCLVNGTLDFSDLLLDLNNECLFNELWLLGYEAEYHKWLPLKNIHLSSFYLQLQKLRISFYNKDTCLEIFSPLDKQSEKPTLKKKLEQKQKSLKLTIEEY